jgi:SAM-dependent methyltransferase
MSNEKSYSAIWFEKNKNNSYVSGAIFAPIVSDFLAPHPIEAVVDVGCGVGGWAAAFKEYGAQEILGVDGDYVDRKQLLIPEDLFIAADLEKPLVLVKTASIAICMEVGEHLPDQSAPVLVKSLTQIAPVVLFSAAIPNQGGNHHINEQWPQYWANLFKAEGYIPVDCIRSKVWTNELVGYYYAQNAFLYVKESALSNYPKLLREVENGNSLALPLVHPVKLESFYKPKPPFLQRAVWKLKQLIKAS